MNFFMVLFFVSLAGIIFMVSKKLRLLSAGQIQTTQQTPFEVPRFEEIQKISGKILRQLGYFLLVETIRIYVRVVQLLKTIYRKIKMKLVERRAKRGTAPTTTKSPNRFLKTMAEYKRKIGKIKAEIKEEENL